MCAYFFMPDFGQNSGYILKKFSDRNIIDHIFPAVPVCIFFMRLFPKFYYARFRAKLYFISPNRWCVCMEHEDFEKLCVIAFRIVAATHKEDCTFQCAFCDICHTLDYLSISWLMEHRQGSVLTSCVNFLLMFMCTSLCFYVIFRRAHARSSC